MVLSKSSDLIFSKELFYQKTNKKNLIVLIVKKTKKNNFYAFAKEFKLSTEKKLINLLLKEV